MSLWVHDNSLVQALELCREFLVPLDVLSALWPCQGESKFALSHSICVADQFIRQCIVVHILTDPILFSSHALTTDRHDPVQRDRYLELRDELATHCEKAGLAPLPPPDFSLPLALRAVRV